MRRTDREITEREELVGILKDSDTCYLSLVDESEPYIVALSYGFEWADRLVLYFHCANTGTKLDILRKSPTAAFFADCGHELVRGEKGCDWGMKYRSVAGRGQVEFVTEPEEKRRAMDLLIHHYSGHSGFTYEQAMIEATTVLRLSADSVTGKRKA